VNDLTPPIGAEHTSAAIRPDYDRARLYRNHLTFRPGRNGVVEIGNAHGKVAVYLDEREAIDVALMYGDGDGMYDEILAAVEAAYPREAEPNG
jgi:hypothetical protein